MVYRIVQATMSCLVFQEGCQKTLPNMLFGPGKGAVAKMLSFCLRIGMFLIKEGKKLQRYESPQVRRLLGPYLAINTLGIAI